MNFFKEQRRFKTPKRIEKKFFHPLWRSKFLEVGAGTKTGAHSHCTFLRPLLAVALLGISRRRPVLARGAEYRQCQ